MINQRYARRDAKKEKPKLNPPLKDMSNLEVPLSRVVLITVLLVFSRSGRG